MNLATNSRLGWASQLKFFLLEEEVAVKIGFVEECQSGWAEKKNHEGGQTTNDAQNAFLRMPRKTFGFIEFQ